MTRSSQKTAVLFFSRSARAEVQDKCLHPEKGEQVAHSLISHTLRQARKSDYPVYCFDEQHQQGATFGDRFANAFQELYNRGYDHVIAIGNDAPGLKAHHIKEAGQQLSNGEAGAVLGPSKDGGAWLMGYSQQAFDDASFRNLPWNSSRLFDAASAVSHQTVTILDDCLTDIDDAAALDSFLHQRWSNQGILWLVQFILSIIAACKLIHQNKKLTLPFPPVSRQVLLRAPPFAE